ESVNNHALRELAARLARKPARRAHLVEVAVNVQLQKVRRMVRRLAHSLAPSSMAEPELLQIKTTHKRIDRPHHILPPDIVLNRRRQKAQLTPAPAGLEGMIRHATNRTSPPSHRHKFLPSLEAKSGLRAAMR